MSYASILEKDYIGKKVTANLEEMSSDDVEFDWDGNWSDDGEIELPGGEGHINLDYRDYLSEDDCEDEDDDMDEDSDDESDDDDFDERENWSIQTGLDFSVNNDGIIESIEITAEVSCFGDSGLGDCDPDDEWTNEDLRLARDFFDSITA